MDKFWIIFEREYTSRVLKKTFLIFTILTPILFSLLMFLPAIAAKYFENEQYEIKVIDPSGKIFASLKEREENDMLFVATREPLEKLQKELVEFEKKSKERGTKTERDIGILLLPEDISKKQLSASFYSTKALSIKFEAKLSKTLEKVFYDHKIINMGLSPQQISEAEVELDLVTKKISEKGEEKTSAALGYVFAYLMSFLNYFLIFIYGSILMQGVLEEKANRIMEVMISSVRPLPMMFAKILSIASVGLTQLFVWIILIALITVIGGLTLGDTLAASSVSDVDSSAEQREIAQKVLGAIQSFKLSYILYFLFYFLGGYLLYGSLFAAIGASVDEMQDSQQFTTIISIPVIIPIILLSGIMNNPSGSLAFWFSIIPLFSPIIMMARMAATEVPLWEILLSMILLILGTAGAIWVAARIYRVGVLMYGKKPTFKELGKWIVTRE
ncbi:MAG: ABC transporter permease [Bacteroidia bacterium]|nr:ABC transporter permease [Bacteroidia bacterium]MDW8158925.1 ABC transporter permease [Bacteroidia bacterium]